MAIYSESKLLLRHLLLFLSFFVPLRSGYSLSFNISRFDGKATDMVYEGDARLDVGTRTVDFTSATYYCHVGRAFYAEKLRLWDSATRRLTDFSTRFSFTIDTQNRSHYGAGLAFFLAPVGFQIPVNSDGGFLGLFNTTYRDSSLNRIVAVEFDPYVNSDWDPPYEHVGININSIASVVTAAWNASFHSADTADTWVVYNSETKNLSVSWIYQTTPNPHETTSISYQIDLTTVLPEEVMIGFSAATSYYVERHQLESWSFSSNLEVEEQQGNAKRTKLVVGLAVLLGVLLCGIVVISAILRKRKRRSEGSETANLMSINGELERGAGPRRFTYADLVSATNNFDEERKLGQGGFGAVYKGYPVGLDAAVAVKRISRGSEQGKKEFITEVKVISSLRHRNLVQLIGWCHEANEFILVYEFMPNGSLDRHLFGKKRILGWAARLKISVGLASALLYLHEEWEQCVVHRDIKSSNVMLDSGFNVKLGDFGLARLMDHELGPQTTGLAGTFGYLAPEYVSTGRASKESDVYSFGVVAIEIATGRRAVDPMEQSSHVSLVGWVWDLYGRGQVIEAMDDKLQVDFDQNQVERLLVVGLWCAHPDRSLRPTVRQALQVLNFEAAVPVLPNKLPVAVYNTPLPPSVCSGEPFITNSIEEGR
ncbi:L-type lectin-domain containing receptor kinase IX.1 [Eucalyptus grandis]|uniref:L-type lectin-domain containing receptor kinase IX.1 n=1 Tax=Eucalyptus grandis TaxID=71139 RepID=UPI00192F0B18|nr:L-type lectin-domain containing receptor kinase IX.1 [Eucalyptus grandis]